MSLPYFVFKNQINGPDTQNEYLLPFPTKPVYPILNPAQRMCLHSTRTPYWGHTGMSPSICSGIFFWAPHYDLPIYASNHSSPLLKLMYTLLMIYQKLQPSSPTFQFCRFVSKALSSTLSGSVILCDLQTAALTHEEVCWI